MPAHTYIESSVEMVRHITRSSGDRAPKPFEAVVDPHRCKHVWSRANAPNPVRLAVTFEEELRALLGSAAVRALMALPKVIVPGSAAVQKSLRV